MGLGAEIFAEVGFIKLERIDMRMYYLGEIFVVGECWFEWAGA